MRGVALLFASGIEIRWGVLASAVLLQYPLMLAVPWVLGLKLRRWTGAPMSLFGIGALTFVASQVVHIPLNVALGLMGPPRGLASLPLPLVGLSAGLSAGLCEELTRYGAIRWFVKKDRGWSSALQLGAGHGGIEAILFGLLALLELVNVLFAPMADTMGISADDQAALRHAAKTYWAVPWYLPALAGYERLCAMSFHVGASVLVMRAVVRRRVGWLLLAIALHTLLDAPIVYAKAMGHFWLYTFLTIAALGMLALAFKLRDRAPPPLGVVPATDPAADAEPP